MGGIRMADRLTPEKRSWNMGRIKGKDTSIEMKVRQYLFAQGFRFRKNDKRYPGTPDVVLPKYRTVIFVHGCFWHRHEGCKGATTPKTRTEFWQNKFDTNARNDQKNKQLLEEAGWKVIVIWECEIKKSFEEIMEAVIKQIKTDTN
jgi:DNA mismatch endonuclease (patch repair protein)